MLKLFISPGACALASHIALAEAGADFETQVIDLRTGQQRTPEYLAVNPAGSTPALQTDRGVITQNPAILAFVAQTHPDRNLAPIDDPHAFAAFNAFNGHDLRHQSTISVTSNSCSSRRRHRGTTTRMASEVGIGRGHGCSCCH